MLYAQIEQLLLQLKTDMAESTAQGIAHLRRILIFIGFLLMILVALGSAAEVWSLKAQIAEQARMLEKIDFSIRNIEKAMAENRAASSEWREPPKQNVSRQELGERSISTWGAEMRQRADGQTVK